MKRCTGHCCEIFTLPVSPEELRDAYDRWKAGRDTPIYKGGIIPANESIVQDIWLIAPMVIYLGFFKKSPIKMVNIDKDQKPGHFYTCKHFDKEKRICTIYEIRPSMCKRYPYGRKCNYADCTWTGHKARKETEASKAKRLIRKIVDQEKAK